LQTLVRNFLGTNTVSTATSGFCYSRYHSRPGQAGFPLGVADIVTALMSRNQLRQSTGWSYFW